VEVAAGGARAPSPVVTVSGVIEPIRTVGINSQVSGTLLSVVVEEGDVVRRGQALARVDDRELRAQFEAAEAAYQVASAAYERARQLRERRVITLPEYERERTAEAAARAQLDQIRTRLAYTVIEAPVDGVVTEKRVEAGDLVASQTRLFTVADVSTLVVRVGVSELDVVRIAVGDPVTLMLDAFPAGRSRARARVFPTADPGTRLVPVEVALQGDPGRGRPPGIPGPGHVRRGRPR
jgi:membrane fusion protein, multidrug efflux system